MQRSQLLSSLIIMLISSACALQKRHGNSHGHSHSSHTPSGMINEYKAESQRRDLDSLIQNRNYVKAPFLNETKDSKVAMWKKYFTTRGKGSFERYLINGEKYRPLIERTFAKHGLPKQLYFVGLIESGYYVKAKSHANAVGPWQFIKSTGKRYGLKIRGDVDERHSIVKSTEAAALFFGDLYNIFGSWELALAAYNAGEYGVIRRIRKARTRDFYELSRRKKLPTETRNYVPKIRAAMEVYRDAKKHNISIPIYKNDSFKGIKKVTIKRSTYIRDLARQYGLSQSTLKAFNVDLKRNATPTVPYTLVIPSHSKTMASSFKAKPIKRRISRSNTRKPANTKKSYTRYKVRKGDNLTWIAKRNRTTIKEIVKLNKLKRKTVFIGQRLKLPKKNHKLYTVRSGDFLLKIAKKHKLSISKLKRINQMKSSKIFPGQKLIVSTY